MHMDSQLNSVVTNLLTSLSVEIIILGWDYLMGIIEMIVSFRGVMGKAVIIKLLTANVQMRLRIRAISPEPSPLSNISCGHGKPSVKESQF